VSTHYSAAGGISILAGRDFDPQRDERATVAVINVATARRLFGTANPIGRRVREGGDPGGRNVYEVIGLVNNAKVETIGEGAVPCVFYYLSDFQTGFSMYGTTMIARSHGDLGQLATAVQREISALDRGLPLFNVKTLDRQIGDALLLPRVSGALFGIFAAVRLVPALVGLYGVVNYSVRTRTREIGIRIALGASQRAVAGSILRRGLVVVGTGLAAGLITASFLSRFAAGLLYGIVPADPVTFLGIPLILIAASFVTLILAALRASRIQPATALRSE
jgi:putative ABC transport system permease protein